MRFVPPPHLPAAPHLPASRHGAPGAIFHVGRLSIYLAVAALMLYLVISLLAP